MCSNEDLGVGVTVSVSVNVCMTGSVPAKVIESVTMCATRRPGVCKCQIELNLDRI